MRSRRWSRSITAFALAGLVGATLGACGGDDAESSSTTTAAAAAETTAAATDDGHDHAEEGPAVVASTSWVAALAEAAGAGEVTVIAPNSAQHPPDYEPKPSDLAAVADADFVVLAGFEGFAQQLTSAAGSDAEVLTVEATYDVVKLENQIMTLAKAFGTTEHATEHVQELTDELTAVSTKLKADLAGKTPVVVSHLFVTEWVAFAGLQPAGTFGPEPITPSQTADLAAKKPAFVFENTHMAGSGAAVSEAAGAKLVSLVNFPGDDLDLVAVATKNADTIRAALAG